MLIKNLGEQCRRGFCAKKISCGTVNLAAKNYAVSISHKVQPYSIYRTGTRSLGCVLKHLRGTWVFDRSLDGKSNLAGHITKKIDCECVRKITGFRRHDFDAMRLDCNPSSCSIGCAASS